MDGDRDEQEIFSEVAAVFDRVFFDGPAGPYKPPPATGESAAWFRG